MSLRPYMQLKLQLKCQKLVAVIGKGRFNHYVTLLGLREREVVSSVKNNYGKTE